MHFPFADLRANGPIDHHPLSPDRDHPSPVHLPDCDSGGSESAGDEHYDLDLRSVAAYPRQRVEWLWPGKIPIGKVTLFVGDPGLGKSLVALDVAARVTRGSAWPDDKQGARSEEQGENPPTSLPSAPHSVPPAPGSVLLLTDDDVGDTIRPRLEAHGANVGRVFFLPAVADLRHDFGQLEAALNRLPDCRLIVVDPVNAYVGPSDSHFHTIARKVLAPLAELAAKKRVAILAVTHLRKRDGSAIQGASGSMGFVAAARSVWTICRDHEFNPNQPGPGRTLFLPTKNNVGPLGTGLAFTIDSHAALDAPVLRWETTPVSTTIEEALKPPTKSRGPDPEERRIAGKWLATLLAEGPQASWSVFREGKRLGFHPRTLQRALHDIGAQTTKIDFSDGWEWSLAKEGRPNDVETEARSDVPDNQGVQADREGGAEKPVAFDETCRLGKNTGEDARRDRRPVDPPPPNPPPNVPPDLATLAAGPSIADSIRYLKRLDAQRKEKSRRKKPPS